MLPDCAICFCIKRKDSRVELVTDCCLDSPTVQLTATKAVGKHTNVMDKILQLNLAISAAEF